MSKLKIITLIGINTIILYTLVCFITKFLIDDMKKKIILLKPNSNLIRASYPNYKDLPKKKAVNIFKEYSSPKSSYQSFTGYRRNEFKGNEVNIDKFGFRKSINHQIDNSYWFMGGSTMWGTGSDDENTIPSIFAKETGKTVLNLGESGYNSFQEFIQLQILLASGYNPKMVFFYDGVNDGGTFCEKNKFPQLQHAYTSRYDKMIKENKKYKEVLKKEKKKKIVNIEIFFHKVKSFYLNPLEYFTILNKYRETKNKKKSVNKIKDIKKNKKYLFCDNNNYAKKASNLTISSWINAYLILKNRNIPVKFILQPTASYHPGLYNLDYLIDHKKQAIINEEDSYTGYYKSLKDQWNIECKKFDICDLFLDLSEVFFNSSYPVFIDTVHISPNGNQIIARKIIENIK